jgi:hypothetical protein
MNATKYKELLKSFLKHGYYFKKFEEFNVNDNCQVILRHDIDLSVDMAVQMATLEKDLGIFSTYHFLLASDSYNVLSKNNSDSIKLIKDMGHSIGLHFDATAYLDPQKGFDAELEIFERFFGKLFSMSLHRPSKSIMEGVDWLPKGILGAYQDKFFNDIKYISDSDGMFRYGHPFEHDAFKLRRNMQLLIHPIWWMTDQFSPVEKVQNFLNLHTDLMSKHIARNIKSWKKHNE